MGWNSSIGWCDATFNPWIGCTKLGPGCKNCYAEKDDHFHKWTPDGWGKGKKRYLTSHSSWQMPYQWNRKAVREGITYRVFCGSLCDIFDDEVDVLWLHDLIKVIINTPNLDWMLLTKRPYLIRDRLRSVSLSPKCSEAVAIKIKEWFSYGAKVMPNVWLGCSIVNDEEMWMAYELLKMPAVIHFLSIEPMLGPVDIDDPELEIDWIICGGESGPKARPMHPLWARSLRDQCEDLEITFFFKQWGQYYPIDSIQRKNDIIVSDLPVSYMQPMRKASKKEAGRLLDGREWNEFPEVASANAHE